MLSRSRCGAVTLIFGLLVSAGPTMAQKDKEALRNEERDDYFKKWLDQDVLYIISSEERAVFGKLQTAEEKEQFIEQFWFRRDPDPTTASNEFKEEHYRRIAYANERFSSGLPGWMTDRGRIYIIHGPPAEIESHATGGTYQRPTHEGGGTTSTYPFEVWRYRHVEGIGSDIILEFVDPTMSGEYRLALGPEEKDALLFVPNAGLTLAESMGMASKADRPFFSPGNSNYPFMVQRAEDSAFARYERYSKIQRPGIVKYQDLKQLVEVNVSFNNLPFKVRADYFRLNQQSTLVPLTLELDNSNLSFAVENGQKLAKVAVYGLVTSISNRIVSEFEDDLLATLPLDAEVPAGKSMYQKILLLEGRGRYKLDLIVKDLNGENIGVIRQALVPPAAGDSVSASSLILSDFVRQLGEVPKEDQMFVLGDVWIRPSLDGRFQSGMPVNAYFQLYDLGVDQQTGQPSFRVEFRVRDRSGKVFHESADDSGESIEFISAQRVVLIRPFDTKDWPAGQYTMEIEAQDRVRNETVKLKAGLEIVNSALASR